MLSTESSNIKTASSNYQRELMIKLAFCFLYTLIKRATPLRYANRDAESSLFVVW